MSCNRNPSLQRSSAPDLSAQPEAGALAGLTSLAQTRDMLVSELVLGIQLLGHAELASLPIELHLE